jgi:AcrR family transcriptional regulator
MQNKQSSLIVYGRAGLLVISMRYRPLMATQAERSDRMRKRLLEATVRSLGERGYTRTSTTEVSRRARVSRGAQLHHFPTKSELVAAAVEHVFEERLRDFAAFVRELSLKQPLELRAVFAFLWRVYSSEAFYAWLELLVAARTDEALRAHVRAVDRRFFEQAERLCAAALGGARSPDEVAAATRLVLSVFDGLAMHEIVEQGGGAQAVLELFARLVQRPAKT